MYILNKERILQIMEDNELSMRKLASSSGLSVRTLNNIINQSKNVYLETAGKLADGLGVPLAELITEKY